MRGIRTQAKNMLVNEGASMYEDLWGGVQIREIWLTALTIASGVAGVRAPESGQARRQKNDRANHRVTSIHRR
jgi:hypothetical protein